MQEQQPPRKELSAPPSIELTRLQADLMRQYLPPHVLLVFDALAGVAPEDLALDTRWVIAAIDQYKKKNGLEGQTSDSLARVIASLDDPRLRQSIIERIIVPKISVIRLQQNLSKEEQNKLFREIIADLEFVVEALVKNPEYFK